MKYVVPEIIKKELTNKDKMRVWTFQNVQCIERLKRNGVLYGDDPSTFTDIDKELFQEPYFYMKKQMKQRIKNFSGNFPIWAYPRRPNIKKHCCKIRNSQFEQKLIIAEVPVKRILASDFDFWNNVINDFFISLDEQEFKYYENNPSMYKETWNRIFDLKTYKGKQAHWVGHGKRIIQLCIDGLFFNEIIKINGLDKK